MADIRIKDLPAEASPVASEVLAIDGSTTRQTTIQKLVDAGAPVASQAEAEAGTNPSKRMTPLTTRQAFDSYGPVAFATAAQGALADSALQPSDIGTGAGTVAAGDDTRIVNAVQNSRAVNTGAGLTGGGDLSADRSIALNSASIASLALADTADQPVASIAALKAAATATGRVMTLTAAGRSGSFVWRLGNYSTQIAADTTEAIYVKATAVAATVGAWVRIGGWQVSGINPNWCGVVGDGATIDTVAFQAALTLAGFIGSGTVQWAGQTALIDATLSAPAAVTLLGDLTGVIKQKNAGGLAELITFGNNAGSRGIVYDGNRANNTDNAAYVSARIGNSNDVLFEGNTVRNSTGNGIVVNNGLRAKINKNLVTNFYDHGIAAYGNSSKHAHIIKENLVTSIGWSGIFLQQSDYSDVSENTIIGQMIGGRSARVNVNTSGTTVTWVSGPDFSTIKAGNFVVVNSGAEFRITTVNSATVLTVATTLPTLSNTLATIGSGDLLGVTASNHCTINSNILDTTATFLFGFSLGATAIQCGNNSFTNNRLLFAGKNAINLNGAVGLGFLSNNSLLGNKIFNAGYGGGIGTTDAIAIFLAGGSTGTILDTLISDNTVISFAGTGQTSYWLGTDGTLSFGSVTNGGGNRSFSVANNGIYKDIVLITLSSDWGSTAATSSVTSHGDQLIFTITCSGTGYASNPNFTIQKIVDCSNDLPILTAKIVSNSGGALLSTMWGEQLSVRGSWRAFMAATPASGHVYVITMKA